MADWLRREAVTLAGLTGAALTALAQLMALLPMAPWLEWLLSRWREFLASLWYPLLSLFRLELHGDIMAAISLAVFLAVIGAGVRLSAHLREEPPPPLDLFEHMDVSSLGAFMVLFMVFLFGHRDHTYPRTRPIVWDSVELGKLAVILTITGGYMLGDLLGGEGFHRRLRRLIVLIALILLANFASLYLGDVTPQP